MTLGEKSCHARRSRQPTSSYRAHGTELQDGSLDAHEPVYEKDEFFGKKGAGARGFGYWGEAPAVVTGMYLSNARAQLKVTAHELFFE
jgi:hypothetical protein